MPRTTKEYEAFASLTDRLLVVSKEELDRRMAAYREEASKRVKPGPKPKKRKPVRTSVSRDAGE